MYDDWKRIGKPDLGFFESHEEARWWIIPVWFALLFFIHRTRIWWQLLLLTSLKSGETFALFRTVLSSCERFKLPAGRFRSSPRTCGARIPARIWESRRSPSIGGSRSAFSCRQSTRRTTRSPRSQVSAWIRRPEISFLCRKIDSL